MKVKTLVAALGVALTMNSFAGSVSGAVPTLRENKEIDYQVGQKTYKIKVAVIHPEDRKNTPYIILNHGRASEHLEQADFTYFLELGRYLTNMGFTVVIPIRVGYGRERETDIESDFPVNARTCQAKLEFGAEVMADEGRVINEFVRSLPYINPENGIMGGHSFGGAMAVAVGGHNLPGIKGIVSLSGGMGGKANSEPMCKDDTARIFENYSKLTNVPELWVYGDKDDRLKNAYQGWYDSFQKGGGTAQLVVINNGTHNIGSSERISEVSKIIKQYAIERGVISE